jgi:hypothetical protein
MASVISLELYQQIESALGKEFATEAVKSFEATAAAMERRADELAVQKKLELKDELTKELATKADILVMRSDMLVLRSEMLAIQGKLEGEIKTANAKFEGEFKVVREEIKATEARLLVEIRTLNVKFNFVIALMILALTVMNPVVAELLKRWLKI